MKTLALDSSSQALSVALLDGSELVADYTLAIQKNHSTSLMPAVDFLVQSAGWQPKDLERVVVAQGPGSYTGLRVAVATAKTLAYALSIDLVGISSLYSLVDPAATGLVVPLINARRNSAYVGFYDKGRAVAPDVYASFEEVLERVSAEVELTFVGEVAAFRQQIEAACPHATIKETLPSAYRLGLLGQTLPAVDVHAFVPAYLKQVEAEENWLKDHQAATSSYIKRV